MNEETPEEDSAGSLVDELTGTVGDLATGLPAPVRKNFIKVFAQLCTAATDIGVAKFEGVASEIRANSEARVLITQKTAAQISQELAIPEQYVQIAAHKHAKKIIRERINLDKVTGVAKEQLENLTEDEVKSIDQTEIGDDWLNAFEEMAAQKSSEDMQLLFGKALAEKIKNPSSFSIKSVKLLHELDGVTAQSFQRICSYSFVQKIPSHNIVIDARVPSLGGSAASNSLSAYGLDFEQLNRLHEFGLIIPDYNSYMMYSSFIVAPSSKNFSLRFYYRNIPYSLRQTEDSQEQRENFKLNGVALSTVGKELYSIVDLLPENNFTQALNDYFLRCKLKMEPVTIPK